MYGRSAEGLDTLNGRVKKTQPTTGRDARVGAPGTGEDTRRERRWYERDDHRWRRISEEAAGRRRCAGRDDDSRGDDFATARVPGRPLGRLFLGTARTGHTDTRLIIALVADPGQH